jgi:hypothetical protein
MRGVAGGFAGLSEVALGLVGGEFGLVGHGAPSLERGITRKQTKESGSFLKKRTKKLLSVWCVPPANDRAPRGKVFWFFSSEKNCFLPTESGGADFSDEAADLGGQVAGLA